MAKILITGGSGLIGQELSQHLTAIGHQVVHLSRRADPQATFTAYQWNLKKAYIDEAVFKGVDHIIHLAGAGVADKRWTPARKREILESRVEGLSLLYKYVKEKGVKLKSFVSASAIGYYGADTGEIRVDENSRAGDDFLATVVKEWEKQADIFSKFTKVTKIRIGVVLSEKGGALPQIARPVRLLAGAPLGTGKQYMSWIHIHDLCRIFAFALEKNLTGTYNATAPNPVTNQVLTQEIAKVLGKPLILPNVPVFVMKLMLGEMAGIVLGGNNVISEAIQQQGFNFKFTELRPALEDLFKGH